MNLDPVSFEEFVARLADVYLNAVYLAVNYAIHLPLSILVPALMLATAALTHRFGKAEPLTPKDES